MNSPVQEIKSRLDLVDVISEYIQLKPAGTHNLKALCPFHNEKSPSLMVSRDKQIWHCFGCSKGGDMFSFVQEYEGMSFPETLRHLAERAGVKIVAQNPEQLSQKNKVLDILKLTAKFYQEYLNKKPEAQIARDYLQQRLIKPATAEQFQLGYSPNSWDQTRNFLHQHGYKDPDISLAGLLVTAEGNKIYDRFRGRLMFPIFDYNGAVVGFGARTLQPSEEKVAKYINSPQSLVYDKSQILYGLNFAKSEIKKQDLSVIVEGYLDVISSHQANSTNVVASSGTALTQQQTTLLKRYSNNLALCFDMDQAGQEAAKRGVEVALTQGLNIKIIVVPTGKDPDEYIKTNPAGWQQAIDNAQDFIQYYFTKITSQFNLQEVSGKKQASDILLPIIKKITDPVESIFWLKKLADKLDVEESVLREKMNTFKTPIPINTPSPSKDQTPKPISPIKQLLKTKEILISEKILAAILISPPLLELVNHHLATEILVGENNQALYKNLIIYYTETVNSTEIDKKTFQQHLSKVSQDLLEFYQIIELLAAKEFSNLDSHQLKEEVLTFIDILRKTYILNKRKDLQRSMQIAEEKGDLQLIQSLTQEFNKLI